MSGPRRSAGRLRSILLSSVLAVVATGGSPPAAEAASIYDLWVSTSANRSSASPLQGKSVSGTIYVFVSPTTGVAQARFWLDNPQMAGTPIKTENSAPWDFAGTNTNNGNANPYISTALVNGQHSITVAISKSGGGTDVVTSTFTVANGGPPPTPPPADQVHLAWTGSPATTITVVWRTIDTTVPSVVEYRKTGDTNWQTATGALRTSGTPGTLHEVTLGSLTPSTAYEYRVRSSASEWSGISSTRTAPAPGSADLDLVYVADTGLIGRSDGLATGTEQVRDEIARINPLLVLGGGDYAYLDTDKRYGTLQQTIDAWFNQMQPIASRSVLMPTYGNHEVGEGFSTWAARFPTPEGWNGRRNYSFDVGNVHFTSILAYADSGPLEQASVDWIDSDLAAAKAAGQQWLIPFMHVPGFSNGTNHGANATLRGQLAPIFERHGVKLVIASSDQAYERSYPLKDVTTSSWTRTSSATDCYTTSDGVTWVKVSPGGKLSNISGSFSPFATTPPPSWTAYRDNTSHAFARIQVSAAGTLAFEAWGVKGDGSPPFVKDSFRYTTGACPPALAFTPDALSFTAQQGGPAASKTATLAASDGSAASFALSESASWLSVTPGSGQTPGGITLTADPAGLAPGSYSANITATADGYIPDALPVTLTVTGAGTTYTLLVSKATNRSSPVPLAATTTSGNIYVFTSPDTAGIARVRFFLDNPQMTGTPRRTEANPPYDFAGGTTATASPFDTKTVANGSHTITAAIDFTAGGTEVVNAMFTVSN